MYYFKAIILKGCPYAIALKDLLESKYKDIMVEYIMVDNTTKIKYKTNIINTFPQLYFKAENSEMNILLGGYDSMIKLINILKENDSIDIIKKKIASEYPDMSNKIILRLIQLNLMR